MVTATRKKAWRSGPANGWHDDFIWYAAAIGRMKALTPRLDDFQQTFMQAFDQGFPSSAVSRMSGIARTWSDPASLGYQSQVHASFAAASTWPKHQGRKAIWHQCAHNHWLFIPWHRAYLLEFEAVVRRHIADLGGPAATWGLPYWNYSDYRGSRRRLGLPKPLRGAMLPVGVSVPGVVQGPDGFPNPLFDPTRLMTGDPAPGDGTEWAAATRALQRPHYANQQDTGFVSFGGGVLEAANNAAAFHQASESGELDRQPHGSVHNQVNGSMALFETAALDPVFWIHHCNIDRLWETYANDLGHHYPFHGNPAGDDGSGTAAHTAWTKQKFTFLRPDGTVKTWTAPEVLDVAALGYAFDTISAPSLPPVPPPLPGSEVAPFGVAEGAAPQPVAEARDISLRAETTLVVQAAVDGGGAATTDLVAGAFPAESRWVLRFTGVRSRRPAPTSFEVYLGLGGRGKASPTDATHYVGLLSLFGVYEASRDDGRSTGDGRMRLFDATAQVRALGGDFDLARASIRLVPTNPGRDLAAADMSIGQVTLETA